MAATSSKRERDLSPLKNNSKTPRLTDTLSLIDIINNRFDELTLKLTKTISDTINHEMKESERKIISEVNNKMYELEERISKEIGEQVCDIKREITTLTCRVNKAEEQCSEISELQKQIMELQKNFSEIESKLSRHENYTVASDLRIVGIPWQSNEQLLCIYEAICNTLEVEPPLFKSIYRLRGKNNSPDTTIIVRFESPFARNYILKSVGDFRRNKNRLLTLDLIGFKSDRKFFISESLTSSNHNIFQRALKMKQESKLSAVFTRRGIVHVKFNPRDRPVPVKSMDSFDEFFLNS